MNQQNYPNQMANMDIQHMNKLMQIPEGGTSIMALKQLPNTTNVSNKKGVSYVSMGNLPINNPIINTQNVYAQQNTKFANDLQNSRYSYGTQNANDQNEYFANTEYSTDNESFDSKNRKLKKIDHLVSDINKSLDDYSPSKSIISDETEEEDNISHKKSSYGSYIPTCLKEPILLIIIYVIMSQEFIHKMLCNYISYVNVQDDGRVPLIGIIIYGSILALIFMIFKKILI